MNAQTHKRSLSVNKVCAVTARSTEHQVTACSGSCRTRLTALAAQARTSSQNAAKLAGVQSAAAAVSARYSAEHCTTSDSALTESVSSPAMRTAHTSAHSTCSADVRAAALYSTAADNAGASSREYGGCVRSPCQSVQQRSTRSHSASLRRLSHRTRRLRQSDTWRPKRTVSPTRADKLRASCAASRRYRVRTLTDTPTASGRMQSARP